MGMTDLDLDLDLGAWEMLGFWEDFDLGLFEDLDLDFDLGPFGSSYSPPTSGSCSFRLASIDCSWFL